MRLLAVPVVLVLTLGSSSVAAQDCYESSILKPAPFLGNHGEVIQLADGSLWEVQYEYEYMYEYYPDVIVCPSIGQLIVDDERLDVVPISEVVAPARGDTKAEHQPSVIESQIDGDFDGWEGETIVKLVNGQIWQQSEYHYEYHYAFMPEVLVYASGGGYKMQVEGTNQAVSVERLR